MMTRASPFCTMLPWRRADTTASPGMSKKKGRFDWVIGADPARRLPAVDPHNRELLLSVGAFTENLSLAAAGYGYDLQVQVLASKPTDEEILKVVLKKEQGVDYPLNRIASRRTVRNGLKPGEIRKNDIEKLAKPLAPNFFYFPRGSEHGKCLTEWAIESFRDQTNRNEAQRELASWIRFSDKEAKKYRDGLTPESMEITGFSGWWVRQLYGPKDVLEPGFRQKGIDGTAKIAREGGGWVIVTSPGEKVSDLIETGRNFEKMFLLARDLKIAIHPMTQMLEEEKWRNEISKQHGPQDGPPVCSAGRLFGQIPGPGQPAPAGFLVLEGLRMDGFVKSPSAALRCDFVVCGAPVKWTPALPQFWRALHRPLQRNPSFC